MRRRFPQLHCFDVNMCDTPLTLALRRKRFDIAAVSSPGWGLAESGVWPVFAAMCVEQQQLMKLCSSASNPGVCPTSHPNTECTCASLPPLPARSGSSSAPVPASPAPTAGTAPRCTMQPGWARPSCCAGCWRAGSTGRRAGLCWPLPAQEGGGEPTSVDCLVLPAGCEARAGHGPSIWRIAMATQRWPLPSRKGGRPSHLLGNLPTRQAVSNCLAVKPCLTWLGNALFNLRG